MYRQIRLLSKTKKFKPLLGFALAQSPAFCRRLPRPSLAAQLLLEIGPEIFRLHSRRLSRAGGLSQPSVAADDRQPLRRGVCLYLLLDYRIRIGPRPRKQDLHAANPVEDVLVSRPDAVENDLASAARQPQILADKPAQHDIADRLEVLFPFEDCVQQIMAVNNNHRISYCVMRIVRIEEKNSQGRIILCLPL